MSFLREHKYAVEKIAASVKGFYERREPFRISHGSTNSTRYGVQERKAVVDISPLSRVLKVDPQSRIALVQPNVPMDRLVEATLEHGLVPPVVMEFPGITAGGGFSGTGGESSSFKYGYFNETVKTAEMVLGNGNVVTASARENRDLFYGASGAAGSLGITTLLELKLIPAKRYVKTLYQPVSSVTEAISKIEDATTDPNVDYVDGILFSKTQGVIVKGYMTDERPPTGTIQRFGNASDPWYYLHVKQKIALRDWPVTEYIPIADYLFRYDRGGFWVGASAFEYFKFPFNDFTRWWLDDFLHTRMLYRALHASGQSRNYIIQDLALPFSTVEMLIDYSIKSLNIWPLWLCPLRQPQLPTLHPHSNVKGTDGKPPKLLLNVGLWGYGPARHSVFVAKNRQLEDKLRSLGGVKWLYAHTYYDEDEFWQIFDRGWYDELRRKYYAESLPSVWHKVKVDVDPQRQALEESWTRKALRIWPLGGIWGIRKAIESGEYLVARNSAWKQIDRASQHQE